MKSSVFMVLVTCGMLAFTATASADNKPRHKKDSTYNQGDKSLSLKDLVSKIKKHHRDDDDDDDDRRPIDPGKGDGKPTSPPARPGFVWVGDHWERERAPKNPNPQPAARPGFVWVGDHWERERAGSKGPGMIVDPLPGTIIVRDHRKPFTGTDVSQASGGVVVTSSPIIRDHRGINGGQGGVTVTQTPRKPRPSSGGGGGILGAIGGAVSGAVDGIGDAVGAVGNAVGGAASTVGRGAGKVVNTAGHAVGGAASTLGNGAGRVVGTAGNVLGLGGKSDPKLSEVSQYSTSTGRVTVIRDHRTK